MHRKFPQSTVKPVLPSNKSYESKTGCNRTLATVLKVTLGSTVLNRSAEVCPFKSGNARGPARWGDLGLVVFPRQTAHRSRKPRPGPPLEPGPLPLAPYQRGAGPGRGGGPGRTGGPGSKGGKGPGRWCSSACTESRSVGIPRAGSPQRAGTPLILVNLFLTNLVRISGFSSLFSAIAVFLALSGKKC